MSLLNVSSSFSVSRRERKKVYKSFGFPQQIQLIYINSSQLLSFNLKSTPFFPRSAHRWHANLFFSFFSVHNTTNMCSVILLYIYSISLDVFYVILITWLCCDRNESVHTKKIHKHQPQPKCTHTRIQHKQQQKSLG